jgi:hypothetical protein
VTATSRTAARRSPAISGSGATSKRTPLRTVVAAALLLALSSPALAQQAQLQVTQGPYYAGVPIDMQVTADGFDEEPQPDVEVETPGGAALTLVQARPQVSTMMQIINGKISQNRTVRFGYVYRLNAPAPGRYTVGPFTVRQGPKSAVTRTLTVNVVDVPRASGQKLRVVVPEGPIFIGQRVRVAVEWWTESGLADRLFEEHLNVPLFLDTEHFQFLDDEHAPTRLVLTVDVPGGSQEFPVDIRNEIEGGKPYVVRTFTRTMIPVAAGRYEFGPANLFCEEAVSFKRDIFGSRVPSQSRRLRVAGDPLVVEVQSVPSAGRPASFAGAIGQGFTLDVKADRTVLQAGDPVKLTLTIRGDGTLDAASLPPLAAAGLAPQQFRLPAGDTAGITDSSGKHFEVTVRVLDPSVKEIPPIEYSWFDPSAGRFETTRSQPIALSVRAANVVGAGDVVSAAPQAAQQQPQQQAGEQGRPAAGQPGREARGGASSFTLTGADLSIETDLERLRSSSASLLGSPAVVYGGYGLGLLALALGWLERRRRRIDPVRAKLRADLRAQRSRVSSSRSARDVADALRRMAALLADDTARPDRLDATLAALDEAAFAPGGGEAAISATLRSEAVGLADAMLDATR